MSDMKYIRFEDMGIIIFGSHIPHTTMKQLINDEVVSAGFVSLSDKNASCYGESVGLDVKSDEQDTKLLCKMLNPFI